MKQIIRNEEQLQLFINQIKARKIIAGKRYRAEFTMIREKRSVNANKLYWAWLKCVEAETGNESSYLHDYFKSRYLDPEIKKVFEKDIITYSTKNLNSKEFSEYMNRIQLEMWETVGINLPQPGEISTMDFMEIWG